jgi:hypothetical protein
MSVSRCQTFVPLAKPASIVFRSALLVVVAVGVSVPDVGAAVAGRVGSGAVLVASGCGTFCTASESAPMSFGIVGPNRLCIPDGGSSIFALL